MGNETDTAWPQQTTLDETMTALHDMHCHLGFMENGEDVAAEALEAGTLLFANSVTPEEWAAARERYAPFGNVTVGFGMHPWWVASRQDDTAEEQLGEKSQRARRREAQERVLANANAFHKDVELEAQAQRDGVMALLEEHDPAVIGEIGLDFGWGHIASRSQQLALFRSICSWASSRGGKLLSLHAVRAAQETFDALEETGALESCTCIFHWFTGPSDLLKRAVQAGCYFSCGPRMLATGKGCEYVKAIPAGRLLLETDAPPRQNMPYSYAELRAELEHVAEAVAAIKGADALERIARTSEALLG